MKRENELQMLDSQARMVAEQLERVDSGIMEIQYLRNSLDELKASKEGSEILAPLSNGVFVKTKLEKNNKLLVNVGSGVVVEKNIEETKSLLDERISEMNGMKDNLMNQMRKIEKRLIELGEE